MRTDEKDVDFISQMIRQTLHVHTELTNSWEDFSHYIQPSELNAVIEHMDAVFYRPLEHFKLRAVYRGLYFITNHLNVYYGTICLSEDCSRQLIMGPFLVTPPVNSFIYKTMNQLHLYGANMMELKKYYSSLPVIDYEQMATAACTITKYLFNLPKLFDYRQYYFSDYQTAVTAPTVRPALSINMMEKRHKLEKAFCQALSEGNITESYRIYKELEQATPDWSFPSQSLSSVKKQMAVINYMIKKAAETGGVPPTYLEEIYWKWDHAIEKEESIEKLQEYSQKMIRNYCMTKKNYSFTEYSLYVRKALIFIHLNISSRLTVSDLAKELSISADYLTKLFKKELNCSVIEYINRQKIRSSLPLLNSTTMDIRDIAFHIGLSDECYYGKLFKKYMGMTPSAYQKQFHSHL